MESRLIPFVDPNIDDAEIQAVTEVLKSKNLVEGPRVRSFESKFAKFTNTKHAIACTNGTVALHLAMESSPLNPGDEILTTPFTFIATSNSVLYTGAVPKFVDIDPETWNLNPDLVRKSITPKTKAIMPVHIFGLAADMKVYREIADEHDLYLIEDAAQAHGARIAGQHVGGFGDVGIFSLYVTKNLISGEGGVVTTNNDEIAEKIVSLKNHGRTPKGGYYHEIVGFNARMSDVIGAIADVQMDKINDLLERRKAISEQYRAFIDEINNLDYQHVPRGFDHGNYIFAIDTRKHKVKPEEAVKKLKELGVLSRPIYTILSYQQKHFADLSTWRWSQFVNYPDYTKVKCPIAEDVAINHFEIPVVPSLTENEVDTVKNAIHTVFA